MSQSSFEDKPVAQQSSAQAIEQPEAAVGKHWLGRNIFHCTKAQTCCITLSCPICGFPPDLQYFLYSQNSSNSHRLRSSDLDVIVTTPVLVSKSCGCCKQN